MAPVVVAAVTNPVVLRGGCVAGGPPVAALLMVRVAVAGLDAVSWELAGVAPRGVPGIVACYTSRFVACLPMKKGCRKITRATQLMSA